MQARSKKPWIVGIFVLLILLLLFFFQILVRPNKVAKLTFEAGYGDTLTKYDLLDGPEFLVKLSSLDLGSFDSSVVGSYTVTARHGLLSYTFTAVVRDTQAPVILPKNEALYVKLDGSTPLTSLVASATDRGSSGLIFSASDLPDGLSVENGQLMASELGEFTFTLEVSDPYQNVAKQAVSITVDTAPEISGTKDIYAVAGSELDYFSDIEAIDDVDGDVSASLTCDVSGVNTSAAGEYTITYEAEDSYGLTSQMAVSVTILESADALQELINTHQINHATERIVGAYNPYDGGCFTEEDIDSALDYYGPAFVSIVYDENRYEARGSGYIIKIDDEQILIATNSHVTEGDHDFQVGFFDGTQVPCEVFARTGEELSEDISFVTVSLSDLPEDYTDQLMTVHIDYGYWQDLTDDSGLSVGLMVHADSLHMLREASITGELLKLKSYDSLFDEEDACTQVTTEFYEGCSGSAIIDGYGNLIAMTAFLTSSYGFGTDYTHYWGVPLDNILAYYEEVTGEPLYYQ